MSFLFTIENRVVRPHTETLLISPYKEIWERDTTSDKYEALEDFAYIEFVVSQKKSNPYRGYDESIKKTRIKKDIITREDWSEDELIQLAIKKLQDYQSEASPTYTFFMAAKGALEKMKDFFISFDITETNERTGNPLYKPKEITSAFNDVSTMLQNYNTLQEKVEQETYESVKTKGQKEISPFAREIGIDL